MHKFCVNALEIQLVENINQELNKIKLTMLIFHFPLSEIFSKRKQCVLLSKKSRTKWTQFSVLIKIF